MVVAPWALAPTLTLLLVVGCSGQGAISPPAPAKRTPALGDASLLSLSIENADSLPLKVGSPWKLRVALRRSSTSSRLWVNHRLAIEPWSHSKSDVSLDLKDENGNPPVFGCYLNPRVAEPWDYATMGPGDSISVVRTIPCPFRQKGRFSIVARYKDRREWFPAPFGSTWFSGEIVSNRLDVDVE